MAHQRATTRRPCLRTGRFAAQFAGAIAPLWVRRHKRKGASFETPSQRCRLRSDSAATSTRTLSRTWTVARSGPHGPWRRAGQALDTHTHRISTPGGDPGHTGVGTRKFPSPAATLSGGADGRRWRCVPPRLQRCAPYPERRAAGSHLCGARPFLHKPLRLNPRLRQRAATISQRMPPAAAGWKNGVPEPGRSPRPPLLRSIWRRPCSRNRAASACTSSEPYPMW